MTWTTPRRRRPTPKTSFRAADGDSTQASGAWRPLDLTRAPTSVTQQPTMASLTQITKKRRRRKRAAVGKQKKKARAKASTPKFPIHLE
jgi:hypothetical protein